ncbi:MAG: hypothetical protein K2H93_07680 [Oscillospiraceae bacterium]|nr:hypothetical protein [Oscillospiraceae bacterium]
MVTYGFFDSVDGDRKYNADDISNFFLKLISDGVFRTPANSMQVQEVSGMTVKVSAGWGFIKCKWINNDSDFYLTLDEPDIILDRKDRIVLRLNYEARLIEIAIKKGTPAESAYTAPPKLQRDESIWELSLAYINVEPDAKNRGIRQMDIGDERPYEHLCGWVTGLIQQIDTTNPFAQYDNAFWSFFHAIKETFVPNATLVRQLSTSYITTTEEETTILIENAEYNPYLDGLNVYINGMKLIPDIDFTINISQDGFHSITLTKALDVVGTPVEFEILKSIYAENVATTMTELVRLQQEVSELEEKKLDESDAFLPYTYPDIVGNGTVDAEIATWIQDFSAGVSSGNYTNDKNGWSQFAEENGLNSSVFPDVNGDGIVDAKDATLISEFSSEVGAGNYTDDKNGWNTYMLKNTLSNLQEALEKVSTRLANLEKQFVPIVELTQEEYDALEDEEKNGKTLYVIKT